MTLFVSMVANAQEFVASENDTTIMTEYNDGRLWAYRQIGDIVIGVSNYVEKNSYGKNYQILIFIKNLGESSVLFDPSLVTATLTNKLGETKEMKVYTHEQYMKIIKNQQALAMAITGFSNGFNTGMAGYQNTYTTSYSAGRAPCTQIHTTYNDAAASAARIAANTQMMTLGKMMSDEQKTMSQGYLKLNTIHPDEGIIGYINIKHRNGLRMTVNIPIENQVFSFEWGVAKKKKQ